MKFNTLGVALVAALALPCVTGCSEETSNAAAKTAESATKDMKELGSKAADAAKKIPDQLAELQKATEKELAAADMTIDDLKKKAEAKGGEAKAQLEKLMTEIKSKKDEIAKSLSNVDVKGATADTYAAAKKKVDEAMAELSKLVDKAKGM
jgi:hypothetical protein